MAEECARGASPAWRDFVIAYAPIARGLLRHYFPTLEPELDAHIVQVFRRARENHCSWFQGLQFANEREFLMAFRELVFAYARSAARVPAPRVSMDQTRELLRGLTVVQRELVWMFVKNYETPDAAAILMNAESTARELKSSVQDGLAQLVPGGASAEVVRTLLEAAETSAMPECLPLKTFNNLINGQISWQERDRAERHIGECLHCVDRYTSFQEMIWYARYAQPLPEPEVEQFLSSLGITARPTGFVARLFGKTA